MLLFHTRHRLFCWVWKVAFIKPKVCPFGTRTKLSDLKFRPKENNLFHMRQISSAYDFDHLPLIFPPLNACPKTAPAPKAHAECGMTVSN